jgi:glycosyltransferase involved in cell wall biosynthesis
MSIMSNETNLQACRGWSRSRAAVVVKNYGLHRSQPILLMLDFLLRQGWRVTLVLQNGGKVPRQFHESIRVLTIPESWFGKAAAAVALQHLCFDIVVAFDPHAFCLARRYMRANRLIYYSLELYLKGLRPASYPDSLADFERSHINTISGLIIQSAERRQIFAAEYGLDDRIPTFLLPVCARPAGRANRPRVLPPKGQRRMFHLGGIAAELGVPRFCEAMNKVEGWELVVHGHGNDSAVIELKNRIDGVYAGYYRNARLNQFYFETPDEAQQVCAEMHVGLAWFDGGLSPNFDTAALSSGKIAAYLKHGLPLIVNRVGSYVDVLERAGCAVALSAPEELPQALMHIEDNYSEMSAAALRLFSSTYDFSNYEQGLAGFMDRIVQAPSLRPRAHRRLRLQISV